MTDGCTKLFFIGRYVTNGPKLTIIIMIIIIILVIKQNLYRLPVFLPIYLLSKIKTLAKYEFCSLNVHAFLFRFIYKYKSIKTNVFLIAGTMGVFFYF